MTKETRYEKAQRLLILERIKLVTNNEIHKQFTVAGDNDLHQISIKVICDCKYGISGKLCSHIIASMMFLTKEQKVED